MSLSVHDVVTFLADGFGCPCDYSFHGVSVDEFMLDNCGKWCAEHCDDNDNYKCWEKFLEAWKDRNK